MWGKIVKGIAGFYYVYTAEFGILECKAKGIFRKDGVKPLVGDDVSVDLISEKDRTGNVSEILPRRNALVRPAVANVDQAMVIFAVKSPKPNFHLLNRFLVVMEQQKVSTLICFNKKDLADDSETESLWKMYQASGYRILFASAAHEDGIGDILDCMAHKTTVVAGPSGVGKSSIINLLQQETHMETGSISEKIQRGRHTTRHSQLIPVSGDTFVLDTPGFTSLYINDTEEGELKDYFPEFAQYEGTCRFLGCLHDREPDCSVKKAVEAGKIERTRYEDYIYTLNELRSQKKYDRPKRT